MRVISDEGKMDVEFSVSGKSFWVCGVAASFCLMLSPRVFIPIIRSGDNSTSSAVSPTIASRLIFI